MAQRSARLETKVLSHQKLIMKKPMKLTEELICTGKKQSDLPSNLPSNVCAKKNLPLVFAKWVGCERQGVCEEDIFISAHPFVSHLIC